MLHLETTTSASSAQLGGAGRPTGSSSDNAFRRLWDAGYRRLVPVVPPDAAISEHSTLYKRIGTKQDGRGKTPGTRGRDGKWSSFDWTACEAELADLDRWHEMVAGVGIKTGGQLAVIDADTMSRDFAKIILDEIDGRFGRLPIRVGQSPKAAYVVRLTEPMPYARIEFGDERVEILTEGRQFVAHGTHPKTGKPYSWPRPLVPFDQLPAVKPADIEALLIALAAKLPSASKVITEGATANVSQASLVGDLEMVARAVRALPNNSSLFPSRESYRDLGYAIKAALPDHEGEALEIFQSWCARWTDGENDPDVVESDWRRMRPPFRRGASWLYDLSEQHSGGAFSKAEVWFQPIGERSPPELSPFLEQPKDDAVHIDASPYAFPVLRSIPPRQWLYGGHYIRQFISATVAPGGLGKSSLTIVEALAMASGKPLLGVMPHGRSRVWLWNGEDPVDELYRRIGAAMQYHGLTRDDVGDRLMVDSGRQLPLIIANQTKTGAVVNAPVTRALKDAMCRRAIDVLVLDPFIATHAVTENDNDEIEIVARAWASVANDANCSVELIHHVRKTNGAEVTVEDARGATSLINATRSSRSLTRMTAEEGQKLGVSDTYRRYFRFGSNPKDNLSPPPVTSETSWMVLKSVNLGNGDEHYPRGDEVGVVARFEPERSLQEAAESAVAVEQRIIAGAVFNAMAGAESVELSEILPAVMGALNSAGITKSTTDHVTRNKVTAALSGPRGFVIAVDGQCVRLRTEKMGPGPKAPWKVFVSMNEAKADASDANWGVLT